MDISAFVEDDFDAKSWVNKEFSNMDVGSREQYVSSLIMKLQMCIQEVNSMIDDSIKQTVNSLPRVVREVNTMEQEAEHLQGQLKLACGQVEQIEDDTCVSMASLVEIDTLKSRMVVASEALKEADKWTMLVSDVDEVFRSGDMEKMWQRVQDMDICLSELKEVADYDERRQHLDLLTNRLESELSPSAVKAFSSGDQGGAKKLVMMLSKLGRLSSLVKFYILHHKKEMLEAWKMETHREDATFTDTLAKFKSLLLCVLREQVSWCEPVFPDAASVVTDLLCEVLREMQSSLMSLLQANSSLEQLHQCLSYRELCRDLQSSFECFSDSESLRDSLYAPLRIVLRNYESLESQLLMEKLSVTQLDAFKVYDGVRVLEKSVGDIFAAMHESLTRCTTSTDCYCVLDLVRAQDVCLRSYGDEVLRAMTNIREKLGDSGSNLDLGVGHVWDSLQRALSLFVFSGQMLVAMDTLDSSIRDTCAEHLLPAFTNSNLMFGRKASLFLDDAKVKELEIFLDQISGNGGRVGGVHSIFSELATWTQQLVLDIILDPIRHTFSSLSSHKLWHDEPAAVLVEDLPQFSFSPQEYITKVGQYIMTLPQHFMPLEGEVEEVFARRAFQKDFAEKNVPVTQLWLRNVADATTGFYADVIMNLKRQLNVRSVGQLIMDMDYLFDILGDLGFNEFDMTSEDVSQSNSLIWLRRLLMIDEEEVFIAESDLAPSRVFDAVRVLRGFSD